MNIDLERRNLLRLAVVFAVAARMETGFAMDAAPAAEPAAGDAQPAPRAAGDDLQNAWALEHSSNFRAVYGSPPTKAAFLLFLANVYHLYPEDRFQRLIEEVSRTGNSDKEIYARIQQRLPEIKPVLGLMRYALPALAKQKGEMMHQTLELLGATRRVNGYMEIGTTGRYVGRLRSKVKIEGDIVLLNSTAPSYSPSDVVERGQPFKIGRYVSLNDYAPVPAGQIADRSLDMVTNYIGFHHSPVAKRDAFVQSLHRVLRPGGRMIVRDHDVDSPDMNRMVALAHDVFNMGLGVNWTANQQEIRNFTSMEQLVSYIEGFGFKYAGQPLLQVGDPTRNALMRFVRV
jgi:SAM-dependent methyltransferase